MSTIQTELFYGDELEVQQATSREAGARDRTIDRERVRQVMAFHPEGMTDWEIADALGEPQRKPSLGKRRKDLGAVKVRDADGTPLTRVSHGARCFVWRLP